MRFMRDVTQFTIYGVQNPLSVSFPLSHKSQSWLEALRKNGIIKIENELDFMKVADHIQENYFSQIEENPQKFLGSAEPVFPFGDDKRFICNMNKKDYESSGTEISCAISFLDSECDPVFLNDELIKIFYMYYRRQPYYRNQPLLQKVALKPDQVPLENGCFHVDHLHQISLMLLVSDVTENDTHMEYCLGSNRRNILVEGIELSVPECDAKARDYAILKCTGKKGTLFVFDTSGFHRANYTSNSTRKILHLNITTGHNLGQFMDKKAYIAKLSNRPSYARRMFDYLTSH